MGTAAPHVGLLLTNIEDVRRLLEIHGDVGGTEPGRRHNLEILNKSAIVLLVACWESFIEDVLLGAFNALLEKSKSHSVFSGRVKIAATRQIDEAKNRLEIWQLAGKGWRKVLRTYCKNVLSRFNTPRPKKVDALAEALIGMKQLSTKWRWQGRSNQSAIKALEDLVTLRGSIAHRVQASSSVYKTDVSKALTLIHYLAVISSNAVKDFVAEKTGDEPWGAISYGGVE